MFKRCQEITVNLATAPVYVRRLLVVLLDVVGLSLAFLMSLYLRMGAETPINWLHIWPGLVLLVVTIGVFRQMGIYRAVARYFEGAVLLKTGVVLAVAVLIMYAAVRLLAIPIVVPRASLLIFWFVAFSYVVLSRFAAQALFRDFMRRGEPARLLAIYGAGAAGAQLVAALRVSDEYQPVLFIDDAAALWARSVQGIHVYSPENLAELLAEHKIDLLILAIPSASRQRRQRLLRELELLDVEVRTLPGTTDIVGGRVGFNDVRHVALEDLLGREPVPPRAELFAGCIAGKNVLVTGAGGSIGSELCRQIASQGPRKLVLYEQSEFALYSIEQELREHFPQLSLEIALASVTDEEKLRRVVTENLIQTLYHAAAYKHVPIVEANVVAGVANNVFGSWIVAQVALAADVDTCLLISTDKAVRPTNVMGASKRLAEMIFQALAEEANANGKKTVFSMVRFGNVLGSSGSVVPLFRRQIAEGGPITLTHKDITRYFMMIPEAAQLVIQAGAMARGGDVFVLDMGEPVKIHDLARQMIRLAGLHEKTAEHPDGDIEIRYTGLRPGEKLFEELLIGENPELTLHPRIMKAHEDYLAWDVLAACLHDLAGAIQNNDSREVVSQLQKLVSGYQVLPE